jgi:hypothetical protein
LVVDYVNNKVYYLPVKYRVVPVTRADCDCPDCRAGKHLYALHRWQDDQWQFVGISLQSYASAEDCKQHHYWGIGFQTDDVWEDETPILPPERTERPKSSTGRKVTLDLAAFAKAAEALEQHWLR